MELILELVVECLNDCRLRNKISTTTKQIHQRTSRLSLQKSFHYLLTRKVFTSWKIWKMARLNHRKRFNSWVAPRRVRNDDTPIFAFL